MKYNKDDLNVFQKNVKRPCPVRYGHKKGEVDPEKARYIIELYVCCGLGYSPIRHILGLPNDKIIENVIRQHGFGRKGIKPEKGELFCPSKKKLDSKSAYIIKDAAEYFGTSSDEYIIQMLKCGYWCDDPVCSNPNKCSCGYIIEDPNFNLCPMCGREIHKSNKPTNKSDETKSISLFKL